MLILIALAACSGGISDPASTEVRVGLTARTPSDSEHLVWSPKGAKVMLRADGSILHGVFTLGPEGSTRVTVALGKSTGAEHFDRLDIDLDGDGKIAESEKLTTTPSETRKKWWSSFEAVASIALPEAKGTAAASRPYPMSLWFVFDPAEPNAELVLRWSRRGWHAGECVIDGKPAFVLLAESELDGVFDSRDAWSLARDRAQLFEGSSRPLDGHAWLDGVAYRPRAIDPHGRFLEFESFAPGITEQEEAAKADRLAPDRDAPRAATPLAFEHDFAAAAALAKQDGKRLFVDFETTWCGPCKQMDVLIYTAQAVVAAATNVIAVKVDGDDHRDLVKKFEVSVYPTLILLDAQGNELKRAVGYRSVVEMVEFFRS